MLRVRFLGRSSITSCCHVALIKFSFLHKELFFQLYKNTCLKNDTAEHVPDPKKWFWSIPVRIYFDQRPQSCRFLINISSGTDSRKRLTTIIQFVDLCSGFLCAKYLILNLFCCRCSTHKPLLSASPGFSQSLWCFSQIRMKFLITISSTSTTVSHLCTS